MPEIVLETFINAPTETCFGLLRDPRIQAGPEPVITGGFGLGQTVTFVSSKFGVRQKLTVKVIEFDRPRLLVDEMTEGNFRSFKHIHEFVSQHGGGTLMRDTLNWVSPFGIIGRIVDKLVIEVQLRGLVSGRNAKLKSLAESSNA
jgi:ligand-binding SRPBCC domain-containing protein